MQRTNLLIIIAVCAIVVLPFALMFLYGAFAVVGFYTLLALDTAFGAHLFGDFPWVMWALGGALIGGALGFWSIAPAYGLRRARPLIAFLPFVVLGCLAVLGIAFAEPAPPLVPQQGGPTAPLRIQMPNARLTQSLPEITNPYAGRWTGYHGEVREAALDLRIQASHGDGMTYTGVVQGTYGAGQVAVPVRLVMEHDLLTLSEDRASAGQRNLYPQTRGESRLMGRRRMIFGNGQLPNGSFFSWQFTRQP